MKFFLTLLTLMLAAMPASASVQWDDPFKGVNLQTAAGGLIRYGLGFIGVAGLAAFVYGGFSWMIAGGDVEKVTKAKNIVIWTAVGMTVIVASYAIVSFVVQTLGTATTATATP